jgi:hypothetical protein
LSLVGSGTESGKKKRERARERAEERKRRKREGRIQKARQHVSRRLEGATVRVLMSYRGVGGGQSTNTAVLANQQKRNIRKTSTTNAESDDAMKFLLRGGGGSL